MAVHWRWAARSTARELGLTLYPPLLDVVVDLAGVAGVAEVGQPEGRQPVDWQTLVVPYTQPPPQVGAGGEETIMTL